ncbi:hypothetical protein D7004_13005 [Pedobacter jejuensis]|uniref:Uncharacterized protein n=1 Tax=Pedobacter jejuensis TaxID=1268550 RepID=A0A3N0BTP8_9SPHI|nr:hypothetical protein D7004_13005 [Pedobacter jejuensis]
MKRQYLLAVFSPSLHYKPNEELGLFIAIGFTNNGLGIWQTLKMEHYICKLAPVEANTKQQPFRLLAQ